MRATDVVLAHADLLERMADHRMQGVVNHNASATILPTDGKTEVEVAPVVHGHLKMATTYHVEPELLDVALHRAEHTLREDELVAKYAPRVKFGFCVLGKPWWLDERPGKTNCAHAFTWGPWSWVEKGRRRYGLLVTTWADVSRDVDDEWREMDERMLASKGQSWIDFHRQVQGRWVIANVDTIPIDEQMGGVRQLAALHNDIVDPHNPTPEELANSTEVLSLRRLMCALWGLFDEVLPGGRREPTEPEERRARKVAKRLKIPTQVEMVTLRREANPVLHPGTGRPLEWRLVIDGYYKTIHKGTADERVIWVRGHEKGPKNAPYSQRKNVRNLKR